jgi:hypothetical protein
MAKKMTTWDGVSSRLSDYEKTFELNAEVRSDGRVWLNDILSEGANQKDTAVNYATNASHVGRDITEQPTLREALAKAAIQHTYSNSDSGYYGIFNDPAGSNCWGIVHDQLNNSILFIGGSTTEPIIEASVSLASGAASFSAVSVSGAISAGSVSAPSISTPVLSVGSGNDGSLYLRGNLYRHASDGSEPILIENDDGYYYGRAQSADNSRQWNGLTIENVGEAGSPTYVMGGPGGSAWKFYSVGNLSVNYAGYSGYAQFLYDHSTGSTRNYISGNRIYTNDGNSAHVYYSDISGGLYSNWTGDYRAGGRGGYQYVQLDANAYLDAPSHVRVGIADESGVQSRVLAFNASDNYIRTINAGNFSVAHSNWTYYPYDHTTGTTGNYLSNKRWYSSGGGNDIWVYGADYASNSHGSYNFGKNYWAGGGNTTIDTPTFIQNLSNNGFFTHPKSIGYVPWDYAGSVNVSGAQENIETAGCVIETYTDSPTAAGSIPGNYKIIIYSHDTNEGNTGKMYMYVNQSGYNPHWVRFISSDDIGSQSVSYSGYASWSYYLYDHYHGDATICAYNRRLYSNGAAVSNDISVYYADQSGNAGNADTVDGIHLSFV